MTKKKTPRYKTNDNDNDNNNDNGNDNNNDDDKNNQVAVKLGPFKIGESAIIKCVTVGGRSWLQ